MDLLTPAKPGEDVVVHKPTANISLGLTFVDPDDDDRLKTPELTLCIIKHVRPESISETFLPLDIELFQLRTSSAATPQPRPSTRAHSKATSTSKSCATIRWIERTHSRLLPRRRQDVSEQSGERTRLRRIQSPPKFEDHESKSAQELREGTTDVCKVQLSLRHAAADGQSACTHAVQSSRQRSFPPEFAGEHRPDE